MDRKKQIVYKKVEDLIPYENNPRINNKAIEIVKKSLEEFKFQNPIIVDKNNVIVCGHTRLLASKELGLKEVPCIVADDLTDDQIKAFRIADNSSAQVAEWDMDKLMKELETIDYDMEKFGLSEQMAEIEKIIENNKEVKEDNFETELPEKPKSQLGDIYQLGEHRLMCGDSTKQEDVEKLMDVNVAHLLFTDPPYNVAFNGRSGNFDVIKNDNLSIEDFNLFISNFVDIVNYLKPKNYYIWCNWKFYGILQQLLDFKACIVWAKNVFGLGKGYRYQHEFCLFNGTIDDDITNESDLWEIKKDSNYIHPTQKPIALSARAIKNHKNVNNVVDLFGGSGSTLIACEQLNKKCFMMELDPKYVDVIIARWEQFTGKKAEKLN